MPKAGGDRFAPTAPTAINQGGAVDGPLFASKRLCRAGRGGGSTPRSGRTRFGGEAGPTGFPHAVDGIGLPSTEEHSDDDQGGEGADEPDQNGDFLQSFHENLLLQPWSAVTRRGRFPPLHQPTCTYGAVTLKPPPACRGLTRVAGGLIRCGRGRSSADFDPRAVIGSEDHVPSASLVAAAPCGTLRGFAASIAACAA